MGTVVIAGSFVQNTNSLFLVLQFSIVKAIIQVVLQRDLALLEAMALRAAVYANDIVRHLQRTVFLVSYVRTAHPGMRTSAPVARLVVGLRQHLRLDFKARKWLVPTFLVPANTLHFPANRALREKSAVARVVVAAADLTLH